MSEYITAGAVLVGFGIIGFAILFIAEMLSNALKRILEEFNRN